MRISAPQLPIERVTDIPPLIIDSLEDLRGKRVLITASDGIGDEVLYSSVYALVAEVAAEIVIECDARLCLTFTRTFDAFCHPFDRTVLADRAIQRYRWAPAVDGWIEGRTLHRMIAGSLLARLALGRRNCDGWLRTSEAKRDAIRQHLDPARLNVGVVWADVSDREDRKPLYPSMDDWRPVLDVPGAALWSLQYGRGDVLVPPPGVERTPGLDTTDDIDGVLAACALLDVVVAPACSVVWMASSVGAEVWSPRPWPTRMCTEGRADIPGFPRLRPCWRNRPEQDVAGQPWAPVMGSIAKALGERAAKRAA